LPLFAGGIKVPFCYYSGKSMLEGVGGLKLALAMAGGFMSIIIRIAES
jgi:hypothetical protein